jgi:hypothetical protein
MSKSAAGLFVLTLLCGIFHFSVVQDRIITMPLIACGVFGTLFMAAMVAGRRIKFDPVLR